MYNRGQLMRDRIIIRLAAAVLALAAAVAVPGMAWALGLGEIQTDTRIGQPFTAKIPIVGATADTLQGLKVGLASNDDYRNAGLNEPDYLFSLKFSIEQGPQGPYVRVTSTKPVRLPFLHLLLRANWASGEITRQYTVLLNPPTFVAGSEGGQSVSTPAAPAQSAVVQAPARQAPAQTVVQQPAPKPAQTAARAATTPVQSQPSQPASTLPETYAVHHGDTLWGLAQQMRAGTGITTNQMMIALYRANPHAFRGNINRLKAGYVLQVPTRGEITRIASGEATRIVARQNRDWQSTRVATAGGPAAQASQQQVAANAGTAAGAGAQQAMASATGGRVVLTTPEVTAGSSSAAVPGSAVAGEASGAAVAARTAMNAAASNTASSSAMAGTGASVGGPVKVHSNAMAGLASAAGSQATAATVAAAAKAKPTKPSHKPAGKQAKPNRVNSVNSVSTGEGVQSGLMYWLRQPSGWVVIGAVVLLLATLLLWLVRRRRSSSPPGGKVAAVEAAGGEQEAAATEAGTDGEAGTADAPVIEAEGTQSASGAAAAGGVSEGGVDELGIATYIGGPSLDVNKVDAMDEAELHIGFGDYGKAAQILREGLRKEPERHELRRKLLDVLFAAGDGEGFADEAATYREETGAAADWDEIARMGRQLRPHDDQFAAGAASAGTAASGEGGNSAGEDDLVDLDLDRLSTGTEKEADQSEFERTMDELSTFIETYVPAAGDTPLPLQLPPEEAAKAAERDRAGADEDRGASSAPAAGDDGALDFHLDEEDLPPARPETPKSEAPAASGMEGLDIDLGEGGGPEGGMVDTKLDLARAYIDMGDPDSARGVLEEVIDEGSDEQSGEARRLLESLD